MSLRVLILGFLAGCVAGAPGLETEAKRIARTCTGTFADAGRWHVLDEIHLERVSLQELVFDGGVVVASSEDGGVCLRSTGEAASFVICQGSACREGAFVSSSIDSVRAVVFQPTAVGFTATQSIRLNNRASKEAFIVVSVAESGFRVRPNAFRIGAGSSTQVEVSFAPSSVGSTSAELIFKTQWGEQISVAASGSGDGPLILVQSFVDAGVITSLPPTRDEERRRLSVVNAGGVLPLPRQSPSVRVVRCRPSELVAFSQFRVSDVPPLQTGQSAVVDLFVRPGGDGTCDIEVELLSVRHGVEVAFLSRMPELCRLNTGPIPITRSQASYAVVVQSIDARCFVSWPRVTPDAGVSVMADWSEAILDVGETRQLTVVIDWQRFNPGAWLRLDGNGLGGAFTWQFVEQ